MMAKKKRPRKVKGDGTGWRLGDMSALEAWRKVNPNWRKENAAKAAATVARKKAEAAVKAAADADKERIERGEFTLAEIMAQMFTQYGPFCDCESCGFNPGDTELCVLRPAIVRYGHRVMCLHYATTDKVAHAKMILDNCQPV